jgi:hypothetical protein
MQLTFFNTFKVWVLLLVLCHSQVAECFSLNSKFKFLTVGELNSADAKKEINFVSKWKHMMVH